MKNAKKGICALVAITLLSIVPITAFAASPGESTESNYGNAVQEVILGETKPTESIVNDGAGGDGPHTRANKWEYQNQPLNTSKPSELFSYELSQSYPYGKIWVQNNASKTITTTQSFLSPTTGIFGETRDIAPNGGQIEVYITSNGNYGEYYTSIAHTEGGKLAGYISIRKASTQAELD